MYEEAMKGGHSVDVQGWCMCCVNSPRVCGPFSLQVVLRPQAALDVAYLGLNKAPLGHSIPFVD